MSAKRQIFVTMGFAGAGNQTWVAPAACIIEEVSLTHQLAGAASESATCALLFQAGSVATLEQDRVGAYSQMGFTAAAGGVLVNPLRTNPQVCIAAGQAVILNQTISGSPVSNAVVSFRAKLT